MLQLFEGGVLARMAPNGRLLKEEAPDPPVQTCEQVSIHAGPSPFDEAALFTSKARWQRRFALNTVAWNNKIGIQNSVLRFGFESKV